MHNPNVPIFAPPIFYGGEVVRYQLISAAANYEGTITPPQFQTWNVPYTYVNSQGAALYDTNTLLGQFTIWAFALWDYYLLKGSNWLTATTVSWRMDPANQPYGAWGPTVFAGQVSRPASMWIDDTIDQSAELYIEIPWQYSRELGIPVEGDSGGVLKLSVDSFTGQVRVQVVDSYGNHYAYTPVGLPVWCPQSLGWYVEKRNTQQVKRSVAPYAHTTHTVTWSYEKSVAAWDFPYVRAERMWEAEADSTNYLAPLLDQLPPSIGGLVELSNAPADMWAPRNLRNWLTYERLVRYATSDIPIKVLVPTQRTSYMDSYWECWDIKFRENSLTQPSEDGSDAADRKLWSATFTTDIAATTELSVFGGPIQLPHGVGRTGALGASDFKDLYQHTED